MAQTGFAATDTANSEEKAVKEKEVAVVRARFDNIEKILERYRIPYREIQYRDIEKAGSLDNYRGVFFPCGIGTHVETNVNILSRGTNVQAVFLKEDYHDIDFQKVCDNIERFIDDGGTAYFSGYSYEFIQKIYNCFEFYNNFPNMGVSGRINLSLKDDMNVFCRGDSINGFSPHSGWIVLKSVKDNDVLVSGTFKTVQGEKSGPVVTRMRSGSGELFYTSYHGSRESEEFKRFLVYRVAFRYLADLAVREAEKWEQEINNSVIDSIRSWEKFRIYPIQLYKGANSIHFISDEGFFQVDLYDREYNLVVSSDLRRKQFSVDVDFEDDDYFILKVYPANPRSCGAYSVVTASGKRIIPYYNKIIYGLIFIFFVLIIYIFKRLLGYRKFSGRI